VRLKKIYLKIRALFQWLEQENIVSPNGVTIIIPPADIKKISTYTEPVGILSMVQHPWNALAGDMVAD